MGKALRKKKNFVTMRQKIKKASKKNVVNQVKSKVVLLTDKSCISSTLLFIDKMLSLPNTFQVGQPTSKDTAYSEIRGVRLPSGFFTLVFPTNIRYSFRSREGPFVPKYKFEDINNTRMIKREINQLVNLIN